METIRLNDYSLEGITICYDKAIVELSFNGLPKRIICNGFIGISYLGQWDENIVSDLIVDEEDCFCSQNKEIVKKNNNAGLLGAGWMDIHEKWKHVMINLIDGIVINIACKECRIEGKIEESS